MDVPDRNWSDTMTDLQRYTAIVCTTCEQEERLRSFTRLTITDELNHRQDPDHESSDTDDYNLHCDLHRGLYLQVIVTIYQ